jgi:hypothetical protein
LNRLWGGQIVDWYHDTILFHLLFFLLYRNIRNSRKSFEGDVKPYGVNDSF